MILKPSSQSKTIPKFSSPSLKQIYWLAEVFIFFLSFLSLPFLCGNHAHELRKLWYPWKSGFLLHPETTLAQWPSRAGQPVEIPASRKSPAFYLWKEQWNGKEKKVWLDQLSNNNFYTTCSLIITKTQCVLLSWDVFITSLTK